MSENFTQPHRIVLKPGAAAGVRRCETGTNRAGACDDRDLVEDRCGLLVVAAPRFSAFALVSMIEVFRRANTILGRTYFRWTFVRDPRDEAAPTLTGLLADGTGICRTEIGRPFHRHRYTLVFADGPIACAPSSPLPRLVRASHQSGSTIVEVGSGAFLLASLGLLDHPSYAVHPRDWATFMERYPHIDIAETMFSVGRRTISCCGEGGAIELALYLVGSIHGRRAADDIREALVLEKRVSDGVSSIPSSRVKRLGNRHLRRAVEIMQANIDEPLSQPQVARVCRLSCRQLQRLFVAHTGQTFLKFYLQLRLDRAHALLQRTDMQVMDIAVACGFTSGSYFSQSVRNRWGITPSRVRLQAAREVMT